MKHLMYLWVGIKEAWLGFVAIAWLAITVGLCFLPQSWPFFVWIVAWTIGFLVTVLYWLGRDISNSGY